MIRISHIIIAFSFTTIFSCSKYETGDDFTPSDPPPVPGGYVNSSEISPENLVVHFPFNGNINDTVGTVINGEAHGDISFQEGRKGMAYKGSMNGYIAYEDPGAVANLSSFTVAFWINTLKHEGGAQGVFTLSREDGNFWGNFFVLIEGSNRSGNTMQLKLHFEKPSVPNAEHWVDPGNKYWPDDMYNGWRHIVFTYDENTSRVARYISGNLSALPEDPAGDGDIVNRKASGDAISGTPLGPLEFKDAKKFVIGGFQNVLGTPYNAPEPWMLNYTGLLDEFRIYKVALNPQEVSALYTLERQNR